jgi:ATP-dependent Clp protease ATP-binding subunit ClpA
LLGLLREEEGLAAMTLAQLGVGLDDARARVVRIVGPGDMEVSGQVPFTPRAKKALESALREAVSLGHQYVGTEHLLLGLVRDDEGAAIRILADLGQDGESVRAAVKRVMPAPSPRRAVRSQLRARCPTCSAPLEPLTADAPDAVLDVSGEGERECAGCGTRWTVAYRVAWKDRDEKEGS